MNARLEALTGLRLLDPALLLLALLVPLLLWLRRRRGAPAVRFAPGLLLDPGLPRSLRQRVVWLPAAFQALALVLAVVALARPVRRDRLPIETEGIDILLCLDVSSSMAARDMDPERSRLDLARETAAQFVAARPDDRIGLIPFARYPDVLCPLTLDHAAVARLLAGLERVEPDGPEDATGIGTAVARAAQVLRGSRAKSKVVILLTDGEENVATAETPEEIGPLVAARLCEDAGVRVYTIAAGIGRRDPAGRLVPLDTAAVRRLATRTGGAFYEARDAGALAAVYAAIDRLEKVQLPEPRWRIEERFLPFLAAALALLAAGALLEGTVLRVLP
jgi:Ca-activated chloride channel family protein